MNGLRSADRTRPECPNSTRRALMCQAADRRSHGQDDTQRAKRTMRSSWGGSTSDAAMPAAKSALYCMNVRSVTRVRTYNAILRHGRTAVCHSAVHCRCLPTEYSSSELTRTQRGQHIRNLRVRSSHSRLAPPGSKRAWALLKSPPCKASKLAGRNNAAQHQHRNHGDQNCRRPRMSTLT